MITPRFKLSQSEKTLMINIRAPYSNIKNLEISIEEHIFIFVSTPYYLRLHLPGKILENDFTRSEYISEIGEFNFEFEKETIGEHFPDLELITKLLAPKVEVTNDDNTRKIQILTNGNDNISLVKDLNQSEDELIQDFGFALSGKRNFQNISAEFVDVFEVDPREFNLVERHKMRLQFEQGKFNLDHYLCDYIENDDIIEIVMQQSPLLNLKSEEVHFTDSELDFLKDLANIEHKLSKEQINYTHCCLIDILFAYCYDRRTTYFEESSESGWNIIKLAASFSWLDAFKTPKEALISSFRRCLIYPLYRNFALNEQVLSDLKDLIQLGEKIIIKSLIEMYKIFLKGDCCRYIINNLFITDYIIYVMKWDKNQWGHIVNEVKLITISKNDLGLNLSEIEDSVLGTVNDMSKLSIVENDSDDETDFSSDINESNESSTSSTSS